MTNPPETDWSRALALFDTASKLEGPARARWRQSLAATEGSVLRLLDKLLHAQDRVETADIFNTLPPLNRAARTDDAPLAPDDRAVGDAVGDFELIERIGSGGMGSVWRARYRDARLQREVAIKLPRIGGHRPGAAQHVAERLARERDLLTPLNHPQIARLLDAGVAATGQPFLALELVHGVPIDQWADRARLTVSARVALMGKVLAAVDYAHRNLVLHRDIKPANILVDDSGNPTLLDFGVAKLMAAGDDSPADAGAVAPGDQLTRVEAPALTLAYAAPEQIRRAALTTASDVYACGVLLFRLLTGESPHQPARDSRAALEEAILHHEPAPASRRALTVDAASARSSTPQALRRALQGDLDTILQKALKADPAQRYATAAALADDLQRHLAQQPIHARADSRWYVMGRFVARHRAAVAASALGIAALSGTTAIAVWQASVARAHAVRAEQASARAAAAQQFFAGLFASADPEQNKHITDFDRKMIDRAFATAEAQFGGEPETLATILVEIGEIYQRLGDQATERKVRARAAAIAEANPAMDADIRVRALIEYGWSLTENSTPEVVDSALQRLEEAVQFSQAAAHRVSAAEQVRALAALADGLHRKGRTAEAVQRAEAALMLGQRSLPANHALLALAHKSVATFAGALGDFQKARQAFREAVAIERVLTPRTTAAQLMTLVHWAVTEFDAAQYADAARIADEAVTRGRTDLGDSGGQLLVAKLLLLASHERQGDLDAARAAAQRWLPEDLASSDPLRSGRAHYGMGLVALARDDLPLARQHFAQAARGVASNPHWLARVNAAEASTLLKARAPVDATALAEARALAMAATTYFRDNNPDSRDHARAGQRAAIALAREGRPQQGREVVNQACAWVTSAYRPAHPDRLRCAALQATLDAVLSPATLAQQRATLHDIRAQLTHAGLGRTSLVAQVGHAATWLDTGVASDNLSSFPYFDP